jgi:hypothetical protein
MYVVHIIGHIHHFFNVSKKLNLFIIVIEEMQRQEEEN